jgi:ubiquinone/menaquinone biosynthesis C-methylase UbiE
MKNNLGNGDRDTTAKDYNSVAWFYQWLAHVYSGGQIRTAKAAQISEIRPRDKVLYAGVGSGEDATLAAHAGAEVTCIDLAPRMITKTRRSVEKVGLSAEFICEDVMQHKRMAHYDVVAANFFLNIFPEPTMRSVLAHLALLVKPGGKLLIADFATPRGGVILRLLHAINYWTGVLFYWSLGLEPLHPIYDYAKYLPEVGLELRDTEYFRIFKRGPFAYQTLTARRSHSAVT